MSNVHYDYSERKAYSLCTNKNFIIPAIVKVMKKEFQEMPSRRQLVTWAKRLLGAAVKELEGQSTGNFLFILAEIMNSAEHHIPDIISWNTVICFICNAVVHYLPVPPKPDMVVRLLKSALLSIHTLSVRNLKYSLLKSNEYEKQLFILKKMLNTIMDLKQLENTIKAEFPLLGIKSCYISMYENKKGPDVLTFSRLLIAYKNNECIELKENSSTYPSNELIPGGMKNIDKNGTWFIYSLCYKSELLGFIIYEIEQRQERFSEVLILNKCSLCEVLTIELGNTVKNIMLFNQIEKQTKHIEKGDCEHYCHSQGYILPEKISREYFKKLLMYIENKAAYLDPELSLDILSEQLDISRNHLSFVINKYAKVNFYNFINSYRIAKARDFLEKGNGKINMLKVAYDSGFNSKSTFYKSFKKTTHMTPTTYRRLHNPG